MYVFEENCVYGDYREINSVCRIIKGKSDRSI